MSLKTKGKSFRSFRLPAISCDVLKSVVAKGETIRSMALHAISVAKLHTHDYDDMMSMKRI